MVYYYMFAAIISVILFLIIFGKKRKKALWTFLFCISLIPFIVLLFGAIHSFFNGSGLVGDYGGFTSGLFVIVILLTFHWYIYVPTLILLIIATYKAFFQK